MHLITKKTVITMIIKQNNNQLTQNSISSKNKTILHIIYRASQVIHFSSPQNLITHKLINLHYLKIVQNVICLFQTHQPRKQL